MERRTLLKGAGVVGSGFLILYFLGDQEEQNEASPDYESAERTLEDLSEVIDEADLASPDETFTLPNDILEATDAARTKIAGGSPGDSRTETIHYALEYYDDLRDYLLEAGDILIELDEIERDIVETTGTPEPIADAHLQQFESRFADFEYINEELDTGDEPLSDLLPTRESTLEETRRLKRVYNAFAAAQEGYLGISEDISEGALEREYGDGAAARDFFEAAASTPSASIDAELEGYALAEGAPSLAEYQAAIEDCRAGAEKMKESSQNLEDPSSNDRFGDGLEYVFAAREQVKRAA